MTTDTDTETQDTVAKVGFGVFMAAILGPVGIVIAALAVGIERSWTGRAGRRAGRTGGGWRAHVAAQQDYWDADRAYRARRSAAHRAWWRDGADPAKRPPAETGRLGKWARRAWAAVAVGADRVTGAGRRFAEGARDGGAAAAEARRNGGTFRDIAGARPTTTPTPDGVRDFTLTDLATTSATPAVATPATPAEPATPTEPAAATGAVQAATKTVTPDPVSDAEPAADTQPAPALQQQEEPVTAPTAATTPVAPATETNADLTAADLSEVHGALADITDGVDSIQGHKARLDAAISAAAERVDATGGTSATAAALDSARSVSAQLGAQLGALSASAVEAGDVTSAAEAGLRPAQDAQDTLHSAGASGEFVSAATN